MPVRKCSNGKYRIGNGPCVYTSKAKAARAWAAARASGALVESSDGQIQIRLTPDILKWMKNNVD